MAYIGKTPTPAPLTSSDITNGIVTGEKLNADVISSQTELATAPADTDEFLISDAGVLKRLDASLVGGGGITEADMFRLTANLSSNADPVSSNLERVDDATFSKIGTGMSLSSGIYTFPSTGLYHVSSNHEMTWTGLDSINFMMYVSSDSGANYDIVSANYLYGVNNYVSRFSTMDAFVNVTDASTFRVKFVTSSMSSGYLNGDTDANQTYFMFIRLGDSQ